MAINILDIEEIQIVLNKGTTVYPVNLIGYKEYLKVLHPNKVLYPFYHNAESIDEYLEMIVAYNKQHNNESILLPYYEDQGAIFDDRTYEFFTGSIVGREYVEGSHKMRLSNVINDFIEYTLIGNVVEIHFGSINFNLISARQPTQTGQQIQLQ
ncbi:MAG: hypothetical protein ABS904_00105 [Solibacillus isronensis]